MSNRRAPIIVRKSQVQDKISVDVGNLRLLKGREEKRTVTVKSLVRSSRSTIILTRRG